MKYGTFDSNDIDAIEAKLRDGVPEVAADSIQTEETRTTEYSHNTGVEIAPTRIRGGRPLQGERAFGRFPTNWVDEGVVFEDTAIDSMVFPHIIDAEQYLSNPLSKYYLYYAGYHTGDVRMAHSDNVLSGWTEHASNPIVDTSTHSSYNDHVSSPWVMWDFANSRFEMYAHTMDSSGDVNPQLTVRLTSSDGKSWAHDQQIMSPEPNSTARGRWDDGVRTYLRVYRDGGLRYGVYQGHLATGSEPVGIGFTWSFNGTDWYTSHEPMFRGDQEGTWDNADGNAKPSVVDIGGTKYLIVACAVDGTIKATPWVGLEQTNPAWQTLSLDYSSFSYNDFHDTNKMYLMSGGGDDNDGAKIYSKQWSDLL
jgi:hypothetical protein